MYACLFFYCGNGILTRRNCVALLMDCATIASALRMAIDHDTSRALSCSDTNDTHAYALQSWVLAKHTAGAASMPQRA